MWLTGHVGNKDKFIKSFKQTLIDNFIHGFNANMFVDNCTALGSALWAFATSVSWPQVDVAPVFLLFRNATAGEKSVAFLVCRTRLVAFSYEF